MWEAAIIIYLTGVIGVFVMDYERQRIRCPKASKLSIVVGVSFVAVFWPVILLAAGILYRGQRLREKEESDGRRTGSRRG
jgi:hypothetical protein